MLRSIVLRNLATISDTSMEFSEGLNVITGETGSGKSILVDGLMLATGKRADRSLVRPGTRTASVEAVFLRSSGEETTVRREINVQGRSRVFLNDSLSSLEEVRETLDDFVELYSQRSTPALLKRARQLELVDRFSGAMKLRERYEEHFTRYRNLKKELEETQAHLSERHGSREILLHERSLFQELNPEQDDFLNLTRQEKELEHAEELAGLFVSCSEVLEGHGGIRSQLSGLLSRLRRDAPELEDIIELLEQAEISTAEASSLMSRKLSPEEELAGRKSEITARLDSYHSLISRFGGTLDSMLQACLSVEERLQELEDTENRIIKLEKQLSELSSRLLEMAGELTALRTAGSAELAVGVKKGLSELNLPGGSFRIELVKPAGAISVEGSELSASGAEGAAFFFSANTGMPEGPLDTVASGGELSRVALALALALAGRDSSSTLIFDEIDSGTGGETAHMLAECLRKASRSRQIIVISHLAQIAAEAFCHLAVEKNQAGGMPVTVVTRLESREKRQKELARLLGGGAGADEHASQLLGASGDKG